MKLFCRDLPRNKTKLGSLFRVNLFGGHTLFSPGKNAYKKMLRISDLTIFFVTQIPKLLSEVHPVSVEVEWVPIVVGALFQKIGTPVVSS